LITEVQMLQQNLLTQRLKLSENNLEA